ncbi:MAG: NTP transferase domain-containing protein [Deltaproteobacteria bacterium]|jgi:CTP:molybdopterin cytidylyltransferase MocA|nr:NTP transferase domain-containing protein [Deltaproteobacteria bacterium]
MSNLARIQALIPAAGLSSRFWPRHKALPEPAGPGLLRLAARNLRLAGLERLLVVTGYRGEEVKAEALALGAVAVHNPDYSLGMFSSVKAGLSALTDPPAFLILPVDAALVHPRSILALLCSWAALPPEEAGKRIFIPAWQGRAGHPPLIGGGRLEEILRWEGEDGLRGVLASFMGKEAGRFFRRGERPPEYLDSGAASFLDLPDPGLLCDMDSPEDLAAAAPSAWAADSRPSLEEAWVMLNLAGLSPEKKRHCLAVSAGALRLILARAASGCPADPELALLGGLLHDLARREKNHALAGRSGAEAMGFRLPALVIGAHTELPPSLLPETGDMAAKAASGHPAGREYAALEPETREAILAVYLADKYYRQDRRVSLEERFAAARAFLEGDPVALAGMERRKRDALAVESWFRDKLGAEPAELLARPSGHAWEDVLRGLAAGI